MKEAARLDPRPFPDTLRADRVTVEKPQLAQQANLSVAKLCVPLATLCEG